MLHPVVIPTSASLSCSAETPYLCRSSSARAERSAGSPKIGPYFAASCVPATFERDASTGSAGAEPGTPCDMSSRGPAFGLATYEAPHAFAFGILESVRQRRAADSRGCSSRAYRWRNVGQRSGHVGLLFLSAPDRSRSCSYKKGISPVDIAAHEPKVGGGQVTDQPADLAGCSHASAAGTPNEACGDDVNTAQSGSARQSPSTAHPNSAPSPPATARTQTPASNTPNSSFLHFRLDHHLTGSLSAGE